MSWRNVLNLLEQTDGSIDAILPERLSEATGSGDGSPDVQVKIALAEYRRQYRKEISNEQKKNKEITDVAAGGSDSLF